MPLVVDYWTCPWKGFLELTSLAQPQRIPEPTFPWRMCRPVCFECVIGDLGDDRMLGWGCCSKVWAFASQRMPNWSVPGHGSEPGIFPPCFQPRRVEPATAERQVASRALPHALWGVKACSDCGLSPNSRINISQRQHLPKVALGNTAREKWESLTSGAWLLSRVNPWVLCTQAPHNGALSVCQQAQDGAEKP